MSNGTVLRVALDAPLEALFDYLWASDESPPTVGELVVVPFGRREQVGMVVELADESELPREKLKAAVMRLPVPALQSEWLNLCRFAASYYQRPLGEVALPALPKQVRSVRPEPVLKVLRTLNGDAPAPRKRKKPAPVAPVEPDPPKVVKPSPVLNDEQAAAVDLIVGSKGFNPVLLYGLTGSGKTEVYLAAASRLLEMDAQAQVLILVPEINLTPQLLAQLQERFAGSLVAALHSGLAEGERMRNWLAAHLGRARIVIGTRLSVMASMPHLKMIVIDEEHDASYKQQEGLRYSARDLAIWRARQLGVPVVLGSATPSLETWHHAESGRYRKAELRQRAVHSAVLPQVHLIDLERDKPREGLSEALIKALRLRLEAGEQSLLFLNRRGYAPVLSCEACGWVSDCKRCTAFMVLHKPERRLRCHHCALELRIPHACPTCGNVDLQPLGRGTQRVEEGLQSLFPEARILRIDADSTRLKGSAQAAFEKVHQGEVDVLIGTQMVAKGHDFQNLTLVGVMNPDVALFSHDYRASERLFAQLMQVSGRAGRGGVRANPAEVLVQTRYPQHPLYHALIAHDYPGFAQGALDERREAALPPFVHQALLRAEARELSIALEFLQTATGLATDRPPGLTLHDPIPMTMTRVAGVERAQMLLEAHSRPQLQAFLTAWMRALRSLRARARWSLEVDPIEI